MIAVTPNKKAKWRLIASRIRQVRGGGKKAKKAHGLKLLGQDHKRLAFELGPGTYEFFVSK